MKRAAPNTWKDFEDAFAALCNEHVLRCIQSESNQILSNQGRAQLTTELRDLFRDCVSTADELEAKLKGRP